MKENGYWTKWLAGIVWGGLVTCMLFMANYMWAETSKSQERDQEIKDCHNKDIAMLLKDNSAKFEAIAGQLARQEARTEIILKKLDKLESK